MASNFKKVNLVPSSYFLLKKLNILQYVALGISVLAIVIVSIFSFSQMIQLKDIEKQVDEANQTIARADFATRDALKQRYETLLAANDAGNFNTIPNVYEDMTDFLTCIVKNMPNSMIVESINGEFTGSGVYSYSFAFSSKERSTIAPFLQALQQEEILKYVNISAITLDGGEVNVGDGNNNAPSDSVVDDTVQKEEDSWKFTLVIKTKGGAQ